MSDTTDPVSRRGFCAGACYMASGVALAALFSSCGSGSPSSPSGSGSSSPVTDLAVVNGSFNGSAVQVTASAPPLTDVGGAALVQSIAGAFLLSRASATTFTAIDAVCTHEGCTVTGTDGTVYVCPCHGSRYSRTGQVVLGPAPASLRQYATTFDNGVVTIAI